MTDKDKNTDQDPSEPNEAQRESSDAPIAEENQSAPSDASIAADDDNNKNQDSTDESNEIDELETGSTVDSSSTKKVQAASPRKFKSVLKRAVIWIFWLLLLLVIVALGYGLYLGEQRLESQDKKLAQLSQQLTQQKNITGQLENALSNQTTSLDARLQSQRDEVQQQLSAIETRLRSQAKRLRAMSDTSREDWLLAEAQYLLKLANQRIRIERSAEGAEALLEEADAILRDLEDPDLYDIRRTIAKDLAALRLTKKIDVEGLYLRLAALTENIESIPMLPVSVIEAEKASEEEMTEAPNPSGFWQKVGTSWDNFTSAFGEFVRVRKVGDTPKALLPPLDHLYLQQNLRLMLERAQLALLREHQDIYSQSLMQAVVWVEEHYSPSDIRERFITELEKLSEKNITQKLPDITPSLNRLHEYIAAIHDLKGATSVPEGNKALEERGGQ